MIEKTSLRTKKRRFPGLLKGKWGIGVLRRRAAAILEYGIDFKITQRWDKVKGFSEKNGARQKMGRGRMRPRPRTRGVSEIWGFGRDGGQRMEMTWSRAGPTPSMVIGQPQIFSSAAM